MTQNNLTEFGVTLLRNYGQTKSSIATKWGYNNMEKELKSLQKQCSDSHSAFKRWKRQSSRGPDATRMSGYDNKTTGSARPKPKCFICASEMPLKWACPQITAEKQKSKVKPTEEAEGHQAKYVSSINSGLYAYCKVNRIEIEY